MPSEGIIHDYVCWASQTTFAPPIYHLGAILPAWAWQVTNWGWRVPGRGRQGALQTFLVGPPAAAKSTCLRTALGFHTEFLDDWDGGITQGLAPWIQAEGTVAGLLEVLTDHHDESSGLTPAILFHEEVSSLLEKGGAAIDVMMQLFDEVPFVERQLVRYRDARVRGERSPNRIEMPAIGGVFCGTIKSITDTLSGRHFDGGLVSRSLWLLGNPDPDRFFHVDKDESGRRSLVARWTQLGRYLPALGARGGFKVAQDPMISQRVLEATLFPRFRAAVEGEEAHNGASLTRAMVLVQYIAGLYALSCGRGEIQVQDVQAAVALWEMSLANTTILAGRSAAHEVYRFVEQADRVIRRAGEEGVSRHELNRQHLRLPKAIYDQVVAQLEEERGIVSVTRRGKGRPTTHLVAEELMNGPGVVIQFPNAENRENRG